MSATSSPVFVISDASLLQDDELRAAVLLVADEHRSTSDLSEPMFVLLHLRGRDRLPQNDGGACVGRTAWPKERRLHIHHIPMELNRPHRRSRETWARRCLPMRADRYCRLSRVGIADTHQSDGDCDRNELHLALRLLYRAILYDLLLAVSMIAFARTFKNTHGSSFLQRVRGTIYV